jgi:hypothetical protein
MGCQDAPLLADQPDLCIGYLARTAFSTQLPYGFDDQLGTGHAGLG